VKKYNSHSRLNRESIKKHMKKILLSLLTVGVVVGAGVLATRAFFSDTETSTGNVLQAGAVDLKVDSTAHYNGLVCKDGKWTNDCIPTGSELITNGSFEDPDVTDSAKWQIFSSIPGWTIEWESTQTSYGGRNRPDPALQEYHEGVIGPAFSGDQYAELDTDWFGPNDPLNGEPANVRVYQNPATTVGKKYQLTYYYSPRPGRSAADNELKVRVNGVQVASHAVVGGGSISWTKYTYEFVASASSVKIEFAAGGDANSYGAFLDAISMHEMVCNSTFTELEGKECNNSWELTDLGSTNQFFNLTDVKPGDWGENTISLHVDDNPSYACMLIGNLKDAEMGVNNPETKANDPGEPGELSQFLNVFMWHDDCDNVWESGEQPITQTAVPVNTIFNDQPISLALPPNPMLAGKTQCIGLSWCAGTLNIDNAGYKLTCDGEGMGNLAQTDSMTADVTFYAEQSRHNDGFTCRLPSASASPSVSPNPSPEASPGED
jgi:predicted ribosomally synthesized peptide with SipW-like signal peptide